MFSPTGLRDTVTPRELSVGDIAAIVADFGRAAANAVAAGFDGVEIHASNGYLFHQFFAACSNTRSDAYGGFSPTGRAFSSKSWTRWAGHCPSTGSASASIPC